MKIYRPTKTNLLRQLFGEKNTFPSVMPLYKKLGLLGHNGLDFMVRCKDDQIIHGGQCEPIYMNVIGVGDITVIYVQTDDKGGYGINAIADNGDKFCWWHFDSIAPGIRVGTKLTFGQELGIAGNTGMSTGAHLHFGWYPANESKDNGYTGAADPMPYYDNRFCLDIKTQIGIIQKLIDIYKALLLILK